jgi:hypothetical protein
MPTKPGRVATIPITKAFLEKTEAWMERRQKRIVTKINPDGEEMDATDYEENPEETAAVAEHVKSLTQRPQWRSDLETRGRNHFKWWTKVRPLSCARRSIANVQEFLCWKHRQMFFFVSFSNIFQPRYANFR